MQPRILTHALIIPLLWMIGSGSVLAATLDLPGLNLRFQDPDDQYRLIEGKAGIDTGMAYQARLVGGPMLITLQAREAAEGSAPVPSAEAMEADIAKLAQGGIPGLGDALTITHGASVTCKLAGLPCRAAPLSLAMRGRRADAALIATTHGDQHLVIFAMGPGSHELNALTARFSAVHVPATTAATSPYLLLGLSLLLAALLAWIIRLLLRRGGQRT
ncbi:MAG: hypothetical protein ACPGU7_06750 [Gammaproteobacteria bacterium]